MLTFEVANMSPPVNIPPARKFSIDHLSWSSLSTYAMCPRKYYFHYVERAPKEFVPASLAFGSAFHQAAEEIHQARFDKGSIPNIEALMKIYDACWMEATADARVAHAKGEDAGSLRETAQRMLSVYVSHVVAKAECSTGVQPVAIEHTRRFQLLAEVPAIEMRIDLLEVNGNELIVTDIKTSRSRWNEIKVKESLPQLVLYTLGLGPVLQELGATRIATQFAIVTKSKEAAIQLLRPTIHDDDVNRLKRQISEIWEGIRKQVFVQRPGWQCSQCPYQRRCLG